MTGDAERPGDRSRRIDLSCVPLAIVDGQGIQHKAVGLGNRRGRVRIEAPTQEHYRFHLVIG